MNTDLYWVEGDWPGRLAISPRPRGGDWLEDEVQSWRRSGVEVVVSLLTEEESSELKLDDEVTFSRAGGIEFVSYPVEDRGVPSSQGAFLELVSLLADYLTTGKSVLVHCRQGIGRAAMIAIGILLRLGVPSEIAIKRVERARGLPVPETTEQRAWLEEFARGPRLAA